MDYDPQTGDLTVFCRSVFLNGGEREVFNRLIMRPHTSIELSVYAWSKSRPFITRHVRLQDNAHRLNRVKQEIFGLRRKIEPLGFRIINERMPGHRADVFPTVYRLVEPPMPTAAEVWAEIHGAPAQRLAA